MKTICYFTLIILLVSCAFAQNTSKSPQVASAPATVIREFYRWYIHDLVSNHKNSPWMTSPGRAAMSRYVTQRFISEIVKNEKLPEGEGFDADYFFQTQDTLPDRPKDEASWLKSMSVSDVSIKGTTAMAIVTFLNGYPKVRVTMVADRNVWKIDRVKNAR